MPNTIVLEVKNQSEDRATTVGPVEDFVLLIWRDALKEDSPEGEVAKVVEIHQSQPRNYQHLELATRTLANAMKKSGSPVYEFIGKLLVDVLDKGVDALAQALAKESQKG